MFEQVTDRLFWSLAAIVVGSLISIILIIAFPRATKNFVSPYTTQQTYKITNPTNNPNDTSNNPSAKLEKKSVPYTKATDQVSPDYQ